MWSHIQSYLSQRSDRLNIVCNETKVLLLGNANTGKTSIAFKLAYEYASQGKQVLYITSKSKIEGKFPAYVECMDRNGGNSDSVVPIHEWLPGVLTNIYMKYITTEKELKVLLASIHTCQPVPFTIIIDDLSSFLDPTVINKELIQMNLMALNALIDHTLNYILQKEKNQVQHPHHPHNIAGSDITAVAIDGGSSSSSSSSSSDNSNHSIRLLITDNNFDINFLSPMVRVANAIVVLKPVQFIVPSSQDNKMCLLLKDTVVTSDFDSYVVSKDMEYAEGRITIRM